MRSEHSYYEELAALAAGGYLSEEELSDLQRHSETCGECKNACAEFRDLVHSCLPLTESRLHRIVGMAIHHVNLVPQNGLSKEASKEGIPFSRDVTRLDSSPGSAFKFCGACCGGRCPTHCIHFRLAFFRSCACSA